MAPRTVHSREHSSASVSPWLDAINQHPLELVDVLLEELRVLVQGGQELPTA